MRIRFTLAVLACSAASIGLAGDGRADIIRLQIEGVVITGGLSGGASSFENGNVASFVLTIDNSVPDIAGSTSIGFYLEAAISCVGTIDGQDLSLESGDATTVASSSINDLLTITFNQDDIVSQSLDTRTYALTQIVFSFANNNPDTDPMTSDSLVDALTQSTLNDFSLPEIFFDFDDPLQTQKMEITSVTVFADPCLADTNGDGLISPADFNAWILAFNTQSAACDQNGDGLCTPADFNAWILNYNTGCP